MMNFKEIVDKIENNTIETGYYEGIPNRIYHKTNGLSSTGLKEFSISPEHYEEYLRREETDNLRFGTLVHMAILEPDEFMKMVFPVADRRTKKGKEEHERVKKDGLIPCTQKEFDYALGISNKLSENKKLQSVIEEGKKEISGFAYRNDCLLKIRPDVFHEKRTLIIDLKTVGRGMDQFQLGKLCFTMKWHEQAAFYVYVNHLITGKWYSFAHLFVEDKPPYQASLMRLPDPIIEKALNELDKKLNDFENYLSNGALEDDGLREDYVHFPDWYLNDY